MVSEYRADEYSRQTQRFVNPLYIKDALGGYDFSSTMTFITYKGECFCIFAAHALPVKETTVANIGCLLIDGNFMSLSEVTKSYKIYRNHDIVICNTIGQFDLKNYFELSGSESSTEFKNDGFGWVGFPKKKAINKIHKTKSSKEHIQEYISTTPDGILKWSHANFLLLGVSLKEYSEIEITGHFENKNVEYEFEGFKENGYSLKGMSGGAMFFAPEKINNKKPTLNDLFKFAGIGLEYDGAIIKGASKSLIVNLLEDMVNKKT